MGTVDVDEHGTLFIVWYVASGLNGCALPCDTAMSTAARASARASRVSSRLAKMLLWSWTTEKRQDSVNSLYNSLCDNVHY